VNWEGKACEENREGGPCEGYCVATGRENPGSGKSSDLEVWVSDCSEV
jgi:hypothetical protein